MNVIVLNDFFINFCILCTGIFLVHTVFRKIRRHLEQKSILYRILIGIVQGVFGIALIHFGIPVSKTVVIDLRVIPIMIAAQMGGPISSILAAFIISSFRSFSSLVIVSIVNFAILIIVGIAVGLTSKSKLQTSTQWWIMTAIFAGLLTSTIGLVIPNPRTAAEIVVQYVFAVVVAMFFARQLLEYLRKNDEVYIHLNELSRKDFLTGLQNTRAFHEALNRVYTSLQETGKKMSLLMIDIDHFKQINDTYGHPTGDEVLKSLGNQLLSSTGSNGIVARNGGEEFSVILPGDGESMALHMAERIRADVEQVVFRVQNGTDIRLTVSIGISTVTDYAQTPIDRLIEMADEALYKAKRSGRNCVRFYAP